MITKKQKAQAYLLACSFWFSLDSLYCGKK